MMSLFSIPVMFICVILYIDRLRAPRARPLPPLHQSRPLRTSPRSGLGRHLCLRRSQAYGGALGCAVSRRAQGARRGGGGRRTACGGDARRAGEMHSSLLSTGAARGCTCRLRAALGHAPGPWLINRMPWGHGGADAVASPWICQCFMAGPTPSSTRVSVAG